MTPPFFVTCVCRPANQSEYARWRFLLVSEYGHIPYYRAAQVGELPVLALVNQFTIKKANSLACYNKLMLTPEEERQRALRVSQLYGAPLPHPATPVVAPVPFHASKAIAGGLLAVTPAVLCGWVVNLYQHLQYYTLTDVKAVSILLIPGLLALVIATLVLWHYARKSLDNAYPFGSRLFWLGLFVIIGVSLPLFTFLEGPAEQPLTEIIIRSVIFTVLEYVMSVIVFMILASLIHWLTRPSSDGQLR